MTAIPVTSAPASTRDTTRLTSDDVLPDPAPASTNSVTSWSSAMRRRASWSTTSVTTHLRTVQHGGRPHLGEVADPVEGRVEADPLPLLVAVPRAALVEVAPGDRKSTRLNSS